MLAHFHLVVTPSLLPNAAAAVRRKADLVVEALEPACEVQGWFLAPEQEPIHGLRMRRGTQCFPSRRKRERPEVHQQYPDHPDSLLSGFLILLELQLCWNVLTLEYKDAHGKWRSGAVLHCYLAPFWKWRRPWRKPQSPPTPYQIWCEQSDVATSELPLLREHVRTWPAHPLISVLMPVYNPPPRWLERAIQAVLEQTYPHWELCITDDASTDPQVTQLLQRYAAMDPRIKVAFRPQNGHISAASNTALELCTGEFTALYDNDDDLPPTALYFLAWEILQHPDVGIIFTDEDKIDDHGRRSDPFFKTRWNLEMMLQENSVSHFGTYRTALLRSVGGFRLGMEGSQDWDLALRVADQLQPRQIRLIPRILYHWRILASSVSSSLTAKPYATRAGLQALQDFLAPKGATVTVAPSLGRLKLVHWPLPDPPPSISIIIRATADDADLDGLIQVLLQLALPQDPPCQVLLLDCARPVSPHPRLRQLQVPAGMNPGAAKNWAAAQSGAHYLIFLTDNLVPPTAGWLRELISQAARPEVGAVGPRWLAANGLVAEAGIALGVAGLAAPLFRGAHPSARTLWGRPDHVREVAAVSGGCLAVRHQTFAALGGFEVNALTDQGTDLDFCLRLRAAGFRNLCTPVAFLTQKVTRSVPRDKDAEAWLHAKWEQTLLSDPFFNPQLRLDHGYPRLGGPQTEQPWRDRPRVVVPAAVSGC
jgi:GT2 family glycosyltransferase